MRLSDAGIGSKFVGARELAVGDIAIIKGYRIEKSTFKEGKKNLVIEIVYKGAERDHNLNRVSQNNICSAYGDELEHWINKKIKVSLIRLTAVGNTVDWIAIHEEPQKDTYNITGVKPLGDKHE